MEHLNVGIAIAIMVPPFIWLYGPKRSAFWRAIKLWAEDNELAADLRETRRELRRQVKQRPTVAQLDPGVEWHVEKGGA